MERKQYYTNHTPLGQCPPSRLPRTRAPGREQASTRTWARTPNAGVDARASPPNTSVHAEPRARASTYDARASITKRGGPTRTRPKRHRRAVYEAQYVGEASPGRARGGVSPRSPRSPWPGSLGAAESDAMIEARGAGAHAGAHAGTDPWAHARSHARSHACSHACSHA